MYGVYFHTWRAQEYDQHTRLGIPCHFADRSISVSFSGWCFLALLRWYVLMMAAGQVSPNSEPIIAAAFPRPSSGEGCWTVCRLCSAAGGGEDKRLCVTKGWKKRVRSKEKIDCFPVTVCAWVISQYFLVSLLHLRGVSGHISNLRPITDTQRI